MTDIDNNRNETLFLKRPWRAAKIMWWEVDFYAEVFIHFCNIILFSAGHLNSLEDIFNCGKKKEALRPDEVVESEAIDRKISLMCNLSNLKMFWATTDNIWGQSFSRTWNSK